MKGHRACGTCGAKTGPISSYLPRNYRYQEVKAERCKEVLGRGKEVVRKVLEVRPSQVRLGSTTRRPLGSCSADSSSQSLLCLTVFFLNRGRNRHLLYLLRYLSRVPPRFIC